VLNALDGLSHCIQRDSCSYHVRLQMRKTEEQSNAARITVLSARMPCCLSHTRLRQTRHKQNQLNLRSISGRDFSKPALLNFLLPKSKSPPFPFICFRKREQNLHDQYFFFYKRWPTARSGASSHLSQWCRSRSLSRCLSCSRFLSWK